jgi:hypothetical protein
MISFAIFPWKRCSVCLSLQLFVGGNMSYLRYWCLLGYVVVSDTHIVVCVCFVFLRSVYPMLPDSLDCRFLVAPSVFSNVFFYCNYCWDFPSPMKCYLLWVSNNTTPLYRCGQHNWWRETGVPWENQWPAKIIPGTSRHGNRNMCLVYPMMPVSLDCQLLIAPAVSLTFILLVNCWLLLRFHWRLSWLLIVDCSLGFTDVYLDCQLLIAP